MANDGLLSLHPAFLSRAESLDSWFAVITQPSALLELAALLVCFALAWLVARVLSRSRRLVDERSILFGRRVFDGVLFPVLWLVFAHVAHALLARVIPIAAFKVALPTLFALVLIRLGVKVLQAAFKDTPLVRTLERTISWGAWIVLVLWVSGLLSVVLEELDDIKWKVGGSLISVRTMIEGALTAGVVLLIALWISSAIESRLLRSATGGQLSLRKALSNATRAILMFVGLLVALSSVGIDLTALSVLGGAIGVGIGFGLQKLAASYVSGFVILAERSVRIGDIVVVDGFEGRITDINARYTVVRSGSGRESIVPNEMFISTRVENLTLADSRLLQSIVISVGYDSDVDLVLRLIQEAALAQARVLREPGPGVNMTNFGADGLEFTLNYWLGDPGNGMQNLRSQINLAILKALRQHDIDIPYPQRVLHVDAKTRADLEVAGPERPAAS